MPTRVEEICKKIHILFAKGEPYDNSPDLVILSRTEMFDLLQELNEAMYEVLDQYEATTRAKEKAKLETEREASEIIAKAKLGAEDVQAASLAYTDTMLDEIGSLLTNTTQLIRTQYLEFLAQMDEKQEMLKENRSQLKTQLSELHDLVLRQVAGAGIGIDAALRKELLGSRQADSIDVCQSNFNSFVTRQIDAGNSCHKTSTSFS